MNINLCFHGLGECMDEREPGESQYWISASTFLSMLDAAEAHPNVTLSFDDGNVSDIEVALPALRERGLSAAFFPLAGRLDDPASLGPTALRELQQAGMTIGTHGWEHVPWRGLNDSEAGRELVRARTTLEEASGAKITSAALPLGRYDRKTLRRLKAAGYRRVFTSDRFPARESAWLQARYSVTSHDTAESVLAIIRGRPGHREARNVLASRVKRSI